MNDQRLYDRLLEKVRQDDASDCWLWTGFYHKNRKYAAHRYGGTSIPAPGTKRGSRTIHTHRAMWIAVHGDPGREQCVCHRCDVPLCINPDHLFLGTHKDNMADSKRKGRHFLSAKTHCKRGHPLSGDNLYVDAKTGLRHCKECQRERHRRAYHEKPGIRERANARRALRRGYPVQPLETRWFSKQLYPERFGQPCKVVARPALRRIVVEFPDGARTEAKALAVRRPKGYASPSTVKPEHG